MQLTSAEACSAEALPSWSCYGKDKNRLESKLGTGNISRCPVNVRCWSLPKASQITPLANYVREKFTLPIRFAEDSLNFDPQEISAVKISV